MDQETSASADDPAGADDGIGDDEEGGDELGEEEAPPACLEDAYSMDPQHGGENGALVGTEDANEKLCWSLGGELRNTPSPKSDFEKFSEPKDSPAFVLPPPGSPVNPEVLQSVHKRIQELE